jgi:NAD(P)-dependent dehydrogenase (short-subunit alcohol dehydrogenase family)
LEYRNRVILITGGSSGIGRAVALALSRHDNTLVVTGRRANLLEALAREIEQNGSRCLVAPGDATDAAHAEAVVSRAIEQYGRIDIALLNVGGGPASNSTTASVDTILGCMRSNYDTLIHFYVPVVRQMKEQDSECMIAHVNSLATYFGLPMQGDYTAAKAAGRIFLETARMELEHFGHTHIRIQTIHPGFVATDAVKNDGIPAPNEIGEDEAARLVIQGIQSEVKENRFPLGTALATRVGRIAPYWIRKKILLSEVPERY